MVDETVTGVRVVKGFGQEQRELAPPRRRRRRPLQVARAHGPASRPGTTPLLQLIPVLGQVAVLALGGWLALNGHRQPRHVPRVLVATWCSSSRRCGCSPTSLAVGQQARAGAERILDILDSNPLVDREAGRDAARRRSPATVDFDARPLRLHAGRSRARRLRRCTSTPGETVALVGASGSGKSTVALLLPRFYDVHGRRGHDRRHRRARRHLRLAAPPQSVSCSRRASCSRDSVRDNIAYGRPDVSDAEVERRGARRRGARVHHSTLPEGYDTVVGERGLTLSGGQRQRVALARAIITDPRILILDDATSSIDAETEEDIHDDAASSHGRAHDAARRAPPLDAAARGPHRRRRSRSRRGPGHARGAARARPTLYRDAARRPGRRLRGRRRRGERGRDRAVEALARRSSDRAASARSTAADDGDHAERVATASTPTRRSGEARPSSAAGADRLPAAAAGGGGRVRHESWRPRPSCSPRVDQLPAGGRRAARSTSRPRRGDPTTGSACAASCARYRRPLVLGFGLVVVDTVADAGSGRCSSVAGIDQGVDRRVDEQRCGSRRPCSSSSRCVDWLVTWLHAAYTGRTRPSGCCSRCASGSSRTSNGSRSTTTTARWPGGS